MTVLLLEKYDAHYTNFKYFNELTFTPIINLAFLLNNINEENANVITHFKFTGKNKIKIKYL